MRSETRFDAYYTEFRDFKKRLFDLYATEGAVLKPKDVPASLGTTKGYWLAEWDGRRPEHPRSSASIGDDEIKLFYDLCQIVQPTRSYIIGNSFGLSTFCLATAWPSGSVVAIDTWGDVDTRNLAKPLFERIISSRGIGNVQVHAGPSPQETPLAVKLFPPVEGSQAISLYFIDGLHRNPAALDDFVGALPYLDRSSVVLWHNVNDVAESFETAYERHGRSLFDQHHVLRTHGPMGIDYSSEAHPELHAYLNDFTLIWQDWERYMALLDQDAMQRFGEGGPRRSLPYRVASSAYRRVSQYLPGSAR